VPQLPLPVCARIFPHALPSDATCCQLQAATVAIAIPSPCAILGGFHLLSPRTGVIHVVNAVITAKGENSMTSTPETGTAPAPAAEKPKATKKARVAPQGAHVAKKKGESAKKTTRAKKAPKGAKKATGARDGSKTAKVLDLLKRPGGVSVKELMKATGWQPHSVRGFLSGTLKKKMGLRVASTKPKGGQRSYRIVTN
jgi:Protein of unknown function (DUF3489)